MNFPKVFQIKQAFIVFKCDMGGNLEPKGPTHMCVENVQARRLTALTAVGPWGLISVQMVCAPLPNQWGFLGISLASLERISAEVKILTYRLSWSKKTTYFSRATFHWNVLLI